MSKSTRPAPTIRRAELADIPELVQVVNAGYRGQGGWTTEAHLIAGDRITSDELHQVLTDKTSLENEPILVALIDNKIVGCVQPSRGEHDHPEADLSDAVENGAAATPHSNGHTGSDSLEAEITLPPSTEAAVVALVPESIQPTPPSPSSAMLGLFAVQPEYQSKGVGRALTEAAFSLMRTEWGTQVCVIWVLETRTELLAWYEKLGFVWDGVRLRDFVWPDKLIKKSVRFRIMEKQL
ncbi:acyl-CoA N-acyltransferase [Sistotremastrum niveocremeum HHB9708]|uniref:Acyl-CoA N-acyltransferase n=1 Tax=Sistotremastrum niveocremeum HHB9708 TaxID=1314777 RepID=A0A164PFB6_9AGAM|nr:acyl-CoA N-acyltransferase [Sistotremastrum niveocremeum HHB9708]